MKHSYIIIDDDHNSILKTRSIASRFENLHFIAAANNYNDGLDLVLRYHPQIVFLEIDPKKSSSNLSLHLVDALYRYLKVVPKIIITTKSTALALEAIRYEVFDYYTKPFQESDLRRTLLRYEKATESFSRLQPSLVSAATEYTTTLSVSEETPIALNQAPVVNQVVAQEEALEVTTATQKLASPTVATNTTSNQEKPLIIGVKSYGDYRFIEAADICYLQADNNSTDIHLVNGEMITAFKTLKHFGSILVAPFVRIHNSYIVNTDYVSRIHTGKAVCYLKNTTARLPFSKSYKKNIDAILHTIATGNYLET